MTEQFRSDFETLEERMAVRSANSCQQRNALFDLKTRLESDYAGLRPTMSQFPALLKVHRRAVRFSKQ